ncbi:MAG: hypothetical protein HDS16_01115 [Bacteroides sp.]|nr:hypothetical protein [Bacteroides sp.]
MLVLNCRIEFEGGRIWTLSNVINIRIERNADSMMDWCEIELPSRLRWDRKRECPLKRGDRVKIWLGYGEEIEVAFIGYVSSVYDLERLKIYCGNEMYNTESKPMERGTYRSVNLKDIVRRICNERDIRIDEEIRIGEFYENGITLGSFFDHLLERHFIRSYYIISKNEQTLCFGRLINNKISAVYDIERNVIKNGMIKNRSLREGFELYLVSNSNRNEKIQVSYLIGAPPYRKKIIKYRNLTENELRSEGIRIVNEFYFRTYTGAITVFGGHLLEKYDLIGIKENGEKRGVYEVHKNVITFGLNGFRQTITLGNERRDL